MATLNTLTALLLNIGVDDFLEFGLMMSSPALSRADGQPLVGTGGGDTRSTRKFFYQPELVFVPFLMRSLVFSVCIGTLAQVAEVQAVTEKFGKETHYTKTRH